MAIYEMAPAEPLLIAGEQAVAMTISATAHRVQINIRLFSIDADNVKQLITRGA